MTDTSPTSSEATIITATTTATKATSRRLRSLRDPRLSTPAGGRAAARCRRLRTSLWEGTAQPYIGTSPAPPGPASRTAPAGLARVPDPALGGLVAYVGAMGTRGCGAPSWSFRRLGAAGWVLAAVAAASACAGTGDGPLVSEEAPGEAATTTSVAPPEVSTPEAPTTSEGPPASEGTVEVGGTQYQFTVACQELGAGEVQVEGEGQDPVSGGVVTLYLQAFLGDPYIGLRLEDGTLLEPSLESPLDLYVQDDVIRASAIRFVRDLDLETGTATEVGFGELEIHCYEYSRESPE